MEADTRYGSKAALTAEEARSLSGRIAEVIHERNRLREEVEHLRLIIAEFENLRQFLDEDAVGAIVATAVTNGHFTVAHVHGPTAPPTPIDATAEVVPISDPADDTPKLKADMPALVVDAVTQRHTEQTPDADRHKPEGNIGQIGVCSG